MDYDAVLRNSMATLDRARNAQLAALTQNRQAGPTPIYPSPSPVQDNGFAGFPMDSVSIGNVYADPGLMPDPYQMANQMASQMANQFSGGFADPSFMTNPFQSGNSFYGDFDSIPLSTDPDFLQKQDAIYDKLIDDILMMKELERALGVDKKKDDKTESTKGDLNVVAGNRSDGVKAKKVVIHKSREWNTRQGQLDENLTGENAYGGQFENAEVGEYYQVNVEWEDGSTTTREVRMDSPGQTVYIDSAY